MIDGAGLGAFIQDTISNPTPSRSEGDRTYNDMHLASIHMNIVSLISPKGFN